MCSSDSGWRGWQRSDQRGRGGEELAWRRLPKRTKIGYTVDQFRDYATYAEARPAMRAVLDPLFPAAMPEADRENVCK